MAKGMRRIIKDKKGGVSGVWVSQIDASSVSNIGVTERMKETIPWNSGGMVLLCPSRSSPKRSCRCSSR